MLFHLICSDKQKISNNENDDSIRFGKYFGNNFNLKWLKKLFNVQKPISFKEVNKKISKKLLKD